MNLLQILQEFAKRSGLRVPTVGASATDSTTIQLVALLNEVVEDLSITRVRWTVQTREAAFTSVNALSQGTIESLAPGYLWLIENTFFDRSSHLKIEGPMSPEQWQQAQAVTYSSAYHIFRLWQQSFYLYPLIDAGHSMAFEYKSNALVYDNDTLTFKRYFTKDTDTFAVDTVMLLRGLRWLYRKEKGLPYAEEFTAYEQIVQSLGSHDGTHKDIDMSGASNMQLRGIVIQESSWPVL